MTMSDLVDRYLGAVAALLPKADRQDIVAELRDLIMNRAEALEAAAGRPLDKRQTEALLREIGHPIAVAGRYGQSRALVGPELYPFWLFAVKAMLAIAALAAAIPAVILLATGQGDVHTIPRMIGDFIPTALSLVGCATLIAAAIERGWIRIGDLENWKASDLPRLPDGRRMFVKSRFEGVFELVAVFLFVLWWTGLVHFPIGNVVQAGGGEVTLTVTPVLASLYWPILALAVAQMISSLVLIARPGWVRARAAAELVCAIGGVGLSVVLWPAQPLIVFHAPDAAQAGLANLQRTMDMVFQITLVSAGAINGLKALINAWRLARGK
jgi:predicted secreted protein